MHRKNIFQLYSSVERQIKTFMKLQKILPKAADVRDAENYFPIYRHSNHGEDLRISSFVNLFSLFFSREERRMPFVCLNHPKRDRFLHLYTHFVILCCSFYCRQRQGISFSAPHADPQVREPAPLLPASWITDFGECLIHACPDPSLSSPRFSFIRMISFQLNGVLMEE